MTPISLPCRASRLVPQAWLNTATVESSPSAVAGQTVPLYVMQPQKTNSAQVRKFQSNLIVNVLEF